MHEYERHLLSMSQVRGREIIKPETIGDLKENCYRLDLTWAPFVQVES